MKKKLAALAMAAVMAASLAACSSQSAKTTAAEENTETTAEAAKDGEAEADSSAFAGKTLIWLPMLNLLHMSIMMATIS